MTATNETSRANSSTSASLFSVCQTYDDLKDPNKATFASLATSFTTLIATSLTCPLTIFLNALVLMAFYTKPALRTQANVLLGAMALNDLLRGSISYPLFMAKEIVYQMRRQHNCYASVMLFVTSSPVSDLLLTALNCERFIGLRFPMWHRVHVTKPRLLIIAIASFLTAFIGAAVRVFKEEGRFLLVPMFVISTAATFVFAILIWRVIIKRNQEVQPLAHPNQNASVSSSEKKAGKIATYLAMAFFATRLIPLVLLTALVTEHNLMYEAEPVLQALSSLNSVVNPLIYGLMNDSIKKACIEIVKCK